MIIKYTKVRTLIIDQISMVSNPLQLSNKSHYIYFINGLTVLSQEVPNWGLVPISSKRRSILDQNLRRQLLCCSAYSKEIEPAKKHQKFISSYQSNSPIIKCIPIKI